MTFLWRKDVSIFKDNMVPNAGNATPSLGGYQVLHTWLILVNQWQFYWVVNMFQKVISVTAFPLWVHIIHKVFCRMFDFLNICHIFCMVEQKLFTNRFNFSSDCFDFLLACCLFVVFFFSHPNKRSSSILNKMPGTCTRLRHLHSNLDKFYWIHWMEII